MTPTRAFTLCFAIVVFCGFVDHDQKHSFVLEAEKFVLQKDGKLYGIWAPGVTEKGGSSLMLYNEETGRTAVAIRANKDRGGGVLLFDKDSQAVVVIKALDNEYRIDILPAKDGSRRNAITLHATDDGASVELRDETGVPIVLLGR